VRTSRPADVPALTPDYSGNPSLAIAGESTILADALGETNIPKVRKLNERKPTMGDRSPKSVQKKASQKQTQADASNQKKQALITSQQATKIKAAASKK
jgi:hypothetical protein